MKRILAGIAAVGIGSALLIAPAAAPAMAGTCQSKTGGNNDKVMWTGSRFTCAYVVDNGDNKITPGNTEIFESHTAQGYTRRASCDKDSGGVQISTTYIESQATGSTITWWAFNKQDGNRHWTGAVLWQTSSAGQVAGNQFTNSCKGDTIESNLYNVSESAITWSPVEYPANSTEGMSVRVKAPDGGPTVAGGVVLYRKLSTSQSSANPPETACDGTVNSAGKDIAVSAPAAVQSDGMAYPKIAGNTLAPGEYQIYAAYSGTPTGKGGNPPVSVPGHCFVPPAKLLTPSTSKSVPVKILPAVKNLAVASTSAGAVKSGAGSSEAPGARGDVAPAGSRYPVKIINRTAVTPNVPAAACPKNHTPLNVGVGSPTATITPSDLKWTKQGAQIRPGTIPDGATLRMQLLCRPVSAGVASMGHSTYGSIHADRLSSSAKKSVLYGGRGNDRIQADNNRTLGLGGTGSDQIDVSGSNSAGNGGPGRDRLVARSPQSVLLVGGLGRDVLIGAKGDTMMNAADGHPGDRVVCKSSKNRVLVDEGDQVVGPCTVLTPTD